MEHRLLLPYKAIRLVSILVYPNFNNAEKDSHVQKLNLQNNDVTVLIPQIFLIMEKKPLKIAIIDNDGAIGGIYNQYFEENEQYELHGTYGSVHELLSNFGRSHPDIIICEAMLNGISGIDGLDYFYRKNKDLKVLMMSKMNDFKLIKEAFKKGASGYLIKPITKDRLFNALEALDQHGIALELDVAKKIIGSTDKKVRFTMVGDGPLLEDSIERAKTLGIDEYVDFKGYQEDVVAILSSFDLFLLTSLIEGLPNVLIEAQAMGIPVVSTDAGGASETFVQGGSGYLVKHPSVEKLSETVLEILSDEEFQKSASVVAMEHVKNHFSLQTMHAKLETILFEGLM